MVLCRDLVKTKGNDFILLRCTATYPTALHNTFSMVQETHGHFALCNALCVTFVLLFKYEQGLIVCF